jgi:hypothetical protein
MPVVLLIPDRPLQRRSEKGDRLDQRGLSGSPANTGDDDHMTCSEVEGAPMPKLVRVEVRPGIYIKIPGDQAEPREAEAKKRPPAANKARRALRSGDAPATKAERA